MRIEHVALIHRLEDRSFRVSFPHVPQCSATAGSPRGAVRKGQVALHKYLDACVRKDLQLPARCFFGGPDIGDAFAMVFIEVECLQAGRGPDGKNAGRRERGK